MKSKNFLLSEAIYKMWIYILQWKCATGLTCALLAKIISSPAFSEWLIINFKSHSNERPRLDSRYLLWIRIYTAPCNLYSYPHKTHLGKMAHPNLTFNSLFVCVLDFLLPISLEKELMNPWTFTPWVCPLCINFEWAHQAEATLNEGRGYE